MLNKNKAAILFISLWALVILSILAISITSRVSSEMRLAKYLNERLISLYLAKGAVNRGIVELEKDDTPDADSLYELRTERKIKLGNTEFIFYLIDEESLLNINTVPKEIIGRILNLEPNDELVNNIVAGRNFSVKEQLLLVDGMTQEVYSGIKDLITVYGYGRVNINTVSPGVLAILGLDSGLIDIIIAFRKGENGQEAEKTSRRFEDTASIVNNLNEFTSLSPEQVAQVQSLVTANLVGVGAKNIKIDISTEILGKPSRHYNVIFGRDSGKIKSWQEN